MYIFHLLLQYQLTKQTLVTVMASMQIEALSFTFLGGFYKNTSVTRLGTISLSLTIQAILSHHSSFLMTWKQMCNKSATRSPWRRSFYAHLLVFLLCLLALCDHLAAHALAVRIVLRALASGEQLPEHGPHLVCQLLRPVAARQHNAAVSVQRIDGVLDLFALVAAVPILVELRQDLPAM